MVQVLVPLENEVWNKHVESVWFPRLDAGSIPASSTEDHNKEMPHLKASPFVLCGLLQLTVDILGVYVLLHYICTISLTIA